MTANSDGSSETVINFSLHDVLTVHINIKDQTEFPVIFPINLFQFFFTSYSNYANRSDTIVKNVTLIFWCSSRYRPNIFISLEIYGFCWEYAGFLLHKLLQSLFFVHFFFSTPGNTLNIVIMGIYFAHSSYSI